MTQTWSMKVWHKSPINLRTYGESVSFVLPSPPNRLTQARYGAKETTWWAELSRSTLQSRLYIAHCTSHNQHMTQPLLFLDPCAETDPSCVLSIFAPSHYSTSAFIFARYTGISRDVELWQLCVPIYHLGPHAHHPHLPKQKCFFFLLSIKPIHFFIFFQ